jgi:O-antigen ligase
VIALARRLALLACCGAVLVVLLIFKASLQAPFLVPKFAALEVTASLGFVAFALRRASTGRPTWTVAMTAGVALVLVTTVLAAVVAATRPLGAPYGVGALARWGCLFGLACAASVLDDVPDERQRVLETITITAAAVAAIGLLQHIDRLPLFIPVLSRPGSTFGNRNQAAELMAMALPFGLSAAVGARPGAVRGAMLGSVALELVFLAVTRTRGAWLGGACGLLTAVILLRPRWSRLSIVAALVAVSVAVLAAALPGRVNPYDVGDRKRYSGVLQVLEEGFDAHSTALKTRLGLWRRSLAMVREHPIVGIGPGNWPVLFPRYAEPGATCDGVLSATLAPREAHNDFFERVAETGFLGLTALGILFAGAMSNVRGRLRSAHRGTRVSAAGAGGALVALAALSLTSFPFEMPATIALSGLALGMIAAADRRAPAFGEDDTQTGLASSRWKHALDWAMAIVGLGLAASAGVRAERSVRSSGCLGSAERAMARERRWSGGTAEALEALECALRAQPDNFRARLDYAQALARDHRSAESGDAARKALTIEPYSPNAWAALAAAELDSEDFTSALRDGTQALTLLNDYPFALQIRSRAAERLGDAQQAIADRKRLDEIAARPDNDDTTRAARELLRTN